MNESPQPKPARLAIWPDSAPAAMMNLAAVIKIEKKILSSRVTNPDFVSYEI